MTGIEMGQRYEPAGAVRAGRPLRFALSLLAALLWTVFAAAPSHAQSSNAQAFPESQRLLAQVVQAQKTRRFAEALRDTNRAIELLEGIVPIVPLLLASAYHQSGDILVQLGRGAEAVERHRTALAIREKAQASAVLLSESWEYLAGAHSEAGDDDAALKAIEQAIGRAPAQYPGAQLRHGRLMMRHGTLLLETGDLEGAQKVLGFAIGVLQKLPGEPEARRLLPEALSNNALVLGELWRLDEADALSARALKEGLAAVSNDMSDPLVPLLYTVRSRIAQKRHDYGGALAFARRARDARVAGLGAMHPEVGRATGFIYDVLNDGGWFEQAKATIDNDLKLIEAAIPDNHPEKSDTLGSIARCLDGLGRRKEAEALYRRAISLDPSKKHKKPTKTIIVLLNNLSHIAFQESRYDEAEKLMQEAAGNIRELHGTNSFEFAQNLSNLGMIQSSAGRPMDAINSLAVARRGLEALLPADHPTLGTLFYNLGAVYLQLDQPIEAEARLLRAAEILSKHVAQQRDHYIEVLKHLIKALDQQKKTEAAAQWRKELAQLTGGKR